MNAALEFCLRFLSGIGVVVALLWLGASSPACAQFSSDPWPTVDWGLHGGEWTPQTPVKPPSPNDLAPTTISLEFGQAGIVMHFEGHGDNGLGPVASLVVPPMGEGRPARPSEPEHAVGPLRLGDASFTRTAESFNLHKKEEVNPKDISRQLGTVTTSPNVVAAAPIGLGSMVGIALIVLLVAMAVAYYDRDREDRRLRKKGRRRHRHSS